MTWVAAGAVSNEEGHTVVLLRQRTTMPTQATPARKRSPGLELGTGVRRSLLTATVHMSAQPRESKASAPTFKSALGDRCEGGSCSSLGQRRPNPG